MAAPKCAIFAIVPMGQGLEIPRYGPLARRKQREQPPKKQNGSALKTAARTELLDLVSSMDRAKVI